MAEERFAETLRLRLERFQARNNLGLCCLRSEPPRRSHGVLPTVRAFSTHLIQTSKQTWPWLKRPKPATVPRNERGPE